MPNRSPHKDRPEANNEKKSKQDDPPKPVAEFDEPDVNMRGHGGRYYLSEDDIAADGTRVISRAPGERKVVVDYQRPHPSGSFRVNADEIRAVSRGVGQLAKQFDALHGRRRGFRAAIDQPDVEKAMREFENDWNKAREALVLGMESVSTGWAVIAQRFGDVDIEIATAARRKETD